MNRVSAFSGYFALIVLVCLFSYFNTLKTPFQFDGVAFLQDNQYIHGLVEKGDYYSYFKAYPINRIFNRPLLIYTFTLNYFLGKSNTLGYHLFNLLIHINVTILVFLIVRHIYGLAKQNSLIPPTASLNVPLVAALLFAAHPVQTQAITYLMSRSASLATFFYLCSFYCFLLSLKAMKSRARVQTFLFGGLSLLLMWLGIGVKLIIVSLPLVMVAYYLTLHSGNRNFRSFLLENKWTLALIASPFFLFFFYRLIFSPRGILGINDLGLDIYGRWPYLISQLKWGIFYYLKTWIFPVSLNVDPDTTPIYSVFRVDFFFAIGVWVLLFAGVFRHSRLLIFGLLWMVFTCAPESSIVPLLDIVAEHRLYLPGLGFVLILAIILRSKPWTPMVIVILCSFSVLTMHRNGDWFSESTLWLDAMKKSPQKSRPYSNYARAKMLSEDYPEAIRSYEKAILLNSTYFEPHHNLGNAYMNVGDCERAIESHSRALKINPQVAESMLSIGQCYKTLGKFKESIAYLKQAITVNPRMDWAYRELGAIYYFNLQDKETAKFYFRQALRLNPNHPSASVLQNLING